MTKIIVLDLCNNLLKLLYYCFPGGFFCVKLCQMSKGEVVNFQLLILSKDLMRRMIKNVGISQALTLIFYEVGLTSALCYFFINWLVPKCWKLISNTLIPISRPNIYRVFKMLWRTFLKSCTLRTFKSQNVHTFFHYKNDEENYLHQKQTSLFRWC